jgi:hypothetical protein
MWCGVPLEVESLGPSLGRGHPSSSELNPVRKKHLRAELPDRGEGVLVLPLGLLLQEIHEVEMRLVLSAS